MKSKTIALSLISLVSVLALAGCQNSGDTPSTTPSDTKPADSSQTDSTTPADSKPADSTTAASEVKTPSGAKDLNTADFAGNKVTTYKVEGAIADACTAQAKMVTDAGWKASAMTASPIATAQAWTQTFESGDQMVVLACAEDPTAKGTAVVTMTQTKNALQQ